MKKEYILTFCISFLILATVVVISLMILIPQRTTIVENNMEEYSAINKSNYKFKETNSLTFENLVREYTITAEQIASFKNRNYYVAGNSDPFTVYGTNSSDNTSGNTSNSTTSTQDKITNSNGGVANPDSTGK